MSECFTQLNACSKGFALLRARQQIKFQEEGIGIALLLVPKSQSINAACLIFICLREHKPTKYIYLHSIVNE